MAAAGEAATRALRPRRPCTSNKVIEYLLHVVGRVGGVGVDVVRHGADLPLLHDLRIAHANKVSNDLVSLFKLLAELNEDSGM